MPILQAPDRRQRREDRLSFEGALLHALSEVSPLDSAEAVIDMPASPAPLWDEAWTHHDESGTGPQPKREGLWVFVDDDEEIWVLEAPRLAKAPA